MVVDPQSEMAIPRDLVRAVCKLLSLEERSRLACTCRSFRDAVNHETVWSEVDLRGYRNHNIDVLVDNVLSNANIRKGARTLNLEFISTLQDHHLELLLSSLAKLKGLNLNGCQKISDSGLETIAKYCASRIVDLGVYWNLKVSDKGVLSLASHCQNLVRLNLSGCKKLTDRSLEALGRGCRGLERLDITRCVRLTDDGLLHVAKNCLELRELVLYAVSTFTDRSLGELGSLQHLRFLDLCGAHLLTDDGLRGVAKCARLEQLNLTWCVQVTDVGIVESIARRCTNLELLSLHGILGVTDASVEALAGGCPGLHTLDVNGCGHVRRKDKDHLRSKFPRITCFQHHK